MTKSRMADASERAKWRFNAIDRMSQPPPTSHVAEVSAEQPEEHLDKLPGDVFIDGGGRLRRTCRHCGDVIPYGVFGGRRYCTTRCSNAAARKRRHADPAKLEADRRAAREANRRAYGTPEGRARIQASQRRWREKKAAESDARVARGRRLPQ